MNIKKILALKIYFLFSFIVSSELKNDSLKIYKCEIDKEEPIPISPKNIVPFNPKNIKNKRILDNIDEDGFKDFNIFLDLYNFNDEIELSGLQDNKELYVKGIKKAIDTIKILLKVKPPPNCKFSDSDLKKKSINNWDKTKIGNNVQEGMLELGIDLYIFVRFGDNLEMGETTLASAAAKYLSLEGGQPVVGVININREVDYSKSNYLEYFESIIIHEITHVLGFSNFFFYNIFS